MRQRRIRDLFLVDDSGKLTGAVTLPDVIMAEPDQRLDQLVQEPLPTIEGMTPREDVYCAYAGKITGPLKPGYGGREHAYGPELLMGKVLGDAIDNQILMVKSCTGGTTLHKNWRPPSTVRQSGGEIGPLYTRMMRRFHNVLANLDVHVPAASERGYTFVSHQQEVGTGYFDQVATVIQGGQSSVTALTGSTEEAQFN